MRIHCTFAILMSALLVGRAVAARDEKKELIEHGRAIVGHCAAGEAHLLFQHFDAAMAKAVPEDRMTQVLKDTLAQGKIGKRESEVATLQGTVRAYTAVYQWGDRKIGINVVFDSRWAVSGLLLRPEGFIPPDPRAGYVTKARLRLPFNGEWYVFWGGDTQAQNYHVVARDQRHAYDILMMQGGTTHKGDARRNESYYAFGQPVLAPADGTVLIAVDGVNDNVPGVMNPAQLYGNHVLIDLGNSEYAVICHFKKGSLRVKAGDKVKARQVLGLCGNSGNSSEAHIHVHLQDQPVMGAATGLPAPFTNYLADGNRVARGSPVKGQAVHPAP